MNIETFIENTIWIVQYPVQYAGCSLHARMTIIRLRNDKLVLHSPCHISDELKAEINALGDVGFIIAPGTYHYFHVESAQQAFPEAETLICPGIEQKLPELKFDWLLGDQPDPRLKEDFEQVLIRGSRYMGEVAFFHKQTKTLILVDLIENITDQTPDTNFTLKLWWKLIFRMWNHPKPAPEYQWGWKDKKAAKHSIERILAWDFEQIILAHGDLIRTNAKEFARKAWEVPLSWPLT